MKLTWRSSLAAFAVATLMALVVRLFLVEDFRISSDSMKPGLVAGDLVFVLKPVFSLHLPFSNYEFAKIRPPGRGEVVAFSLPEREFATFVKRVVAIEGDRVRIEKGVLHVNDEPAKYRTQPDGNVSEVLGGVSYVVQNEMNLMKDYGPVDIPKNHFFALGDNRGDSIDSRSWGPIPYSCIKGRVSLIWLSVGAKGLRPERTGLWVQ